MYIDGHADATDLGSFVCIEVKMECTYGTKQIRNYVGLSADIGKLPTYDDLATGSMALCVDTSTKYYYESSSQTWYEQQ